MNEIFYWIVLVDLMREDRIYVMFYVLPGSFSGAGIL